MREINEYEYLDLNEWRVAGIRKANGGGPGVRLRKR